MRRFGLALAIAAAAAGCSSIRGTSTTDSNEPPRVNLAGGQKGFEDANILFANQRYDQAARLCESLLQTRPYYVPAHLLLARSRHAAGKDDSAIPRYRALLNISPNHVEALTELAAIHRSRGETQQAVALLERAYERSEGRQDVAAALLECWFEVTGTDRGWELCIKHLETHPSCVPAANAVIRRLLDGGETEWARRVAESAVQAGARVEDLPDLPGGSVGAAAQSNPEPPVKESAPPAEAPKPASAAEQPEPEPVEPRPPAGNPTAAAEVAPIPPPIEEAPKPVHTPQPPPPKEAETRPPKPAPPQPKQPAARKEPEVAERPARLSPEAQQWIEEGDQSLAEGLAADALEAYRRSRAHGGPESILSVRMERATKSREEARQAVRDLSNSLATAQDPSGHRLRLAAAYLQDGRYLEAQLLLVQVSVMTPGCGEAFYLLGVAYEKRGEWRQARDAFSKVKTLCPGTALDVQADFHLEEIAAHLDH